MDAMEAKLQDLEHAKRRAVVSAAGVDHGKQSICEVCGSITTENDKAGNERHLTGKYHLGWITIREQLKELKEERDREGDQWPAAPGSAGVADTMNENHSHGSGEQRDMADRSDHRRKRDRGWDRDFDRGSRDYRERSYRDRDRDRDRGYRDRGYRGY